MHRGERVERTSLTVSEVAQLWLERGSGPQGRWAEPTQERYARIVRHYIDASTDGSVRPIGAYKLRELSMDRVAAWSLANEAALAPTTARLVLIALNQVCRFAVRRGWLADNPVAKLERGEKPRWRPKGAAILEGDELACFLAHAGAQRRLFEFLAYTGLRISEALGLTSPPAAAAASAAARSASTSAPRSSAAASPPAVAFRSTRSATATPRC